MLKAVVTLDREIKKKQCLDIAFCFEMTATVAVSIITGKLSMLFNSIL